MNKAIEKVLVLGSGPIIIGQGAEFDYSGTQACQVLRDEGIKVILVNNNPATIMTDKTIADVVYIEPLTTQFIEKVIIKETPDVILAGMGGQTALNLAMELEACGMLEKYGVKIIGSNIETIRNSEDRELFKQMMIDIDEPIIESAIASTVEDAKKIARRIGYPIVIRPAFTLGGTGGGFAENDSELIKVSGQGIAASPTNQVLVEKSIKGWKEIEYEMIRDNKGNTICVCNMENFDPVGIHTGDSIVVAPSQTLSDKEYQMLRKASINIVTSLNIIGGCNVQLALNPFSYEYKVIEVNPRVSRSSALASKATGYPIAKVATKIALGYNLDEIINEVTGETKACFEPSIDYCALKFPKWPFEKFVDADSKLGTRMMATGEVMSLGTSFEAALLKAIRSLEITNHGLIYKKAQKMMLKGLFEKIKNADHERIFYLAELMRREVSLKKLNKDTAIDMYFLEKVKKIVELEKSIQGKNLYTIKYEEMLNLKSNGFSDKMIEDSIIKYTKMKDDLTVLQPQISVNEYRKKLGVMPAYKMVDTCGGEFEATSPYYYSSYDKETESYASENKKVIIVGSGPIRIGQGVEFDYCTVHGIMTLRNEGVEAIVINNNPETVSTDYNISDKLYFEPITVEDVMNIIELEKPEGVILQFGGQTAVKLAEELNNKGVNILGTSFEGIHKSEDRDEFYKIIKKCGISKPEGLQIDTIEGGVIAAKKIGYPVIIRPSYVIGGAGMEIIYDEVQLKVYLENNFTEEINCNLLIDEYIVGKEVEVDAVFDGENLLIPGIMEHLEKSGVHSGDSISIYPAQNISESMKEKIVEATQKICKEIGAVGLVNIQYIIDGDRLVVIEINPRASRTIPFISKVTNTPVVEIATKIMLGQSLIDQGYNYNIVKEKDLVSIKYPIFSMNKILDTEIALGPEMKSTGESMSIERNFNSSLYKGLSTLSPKIINKINKDVVSFSEEEISKCDHKLKVIISISERYKNEIAYIMGELKAIDAKVYATKGTASHIKNVYGIETTLINKVDSEENSIIDLIYDENIDLVINIPHKGKCSKRHGFKIRRAAIEHNTLCLTNLEAAASILNTINNKVAIEELEIFDICKIL